MRHLSRIHDALIADPLVEQPGERPGEIRAAELTPLLAQARAERVLYRLHRARYGRTMRRIAGLVGVWQRHATDNKAQ